MLSLISIALNFNTLKVKSKVVSLRTLESVQKLVGVQWFGAHCSSAHTHVSGNKKFIYKFKYAWLIATGNVILLKAWNNQRLLPTQWIRSLYLEPRNMRVSVWATEEMREKKEEEERDGMAIRHEIPDILILGLTFSISRRLQLQELFTGNVMGKA